MIETTYIRLERAAEMLGTDADTLLIAAAERRIQLYGLLNQYRPLAEKFMYWNPEKEDFESLPVPVDPEQHFFDFVPLEPQSCAEALRVGATGEIRWLGFEDQDGKIKWCFDDARDAAFGVSGKPANSTSIDRANIFAKCEAVKSIRDQDSVPERGSIPAAPTPNPSYRSDELALMNQASIQWWARADESDPTTHHDNQTVTAWLIQRGFSERKAKAAASIIRPKWAHNGRKPD